jgi:hypothetical protein
MAFQQETALGDFKEQQQKCKRYYINGNMVSRKQDFRHLNCKTMREM